MPGTIGPLLPADERFDHQIVDTFASVAQTDLSWTEKVCGMACARDGSLQVGFGFGKYTNRNVIDGYCGISRGALQRTVRASRRLSPDPDTIAIGPLSYEVLEPLKRVCVRLEATEHQPIAFELIFEGAVPCFLEEQEDWRVPHGYRRQAHQIRYHDGGWFGLGGGRGQAHADYAPWLGLDARSLLGRTAGRRARASRPRARRPAAEPLGAGDLEPRDCVPDCSERASAERVHQIRDCVIRLKDPVGGGEGIGNCQTVALGAWPDLGLPTAEDSFL